MTTFSVATLVTPASPQVGQEPSARTVAWAWARSTPGWLRIATTGVAVLIAAAMVLGVAVTNSRRSSAAVSRSTAGGALLDAQTVSVSLADADAVAASAYLTPGQPPAELTTQYRNDLADAAASLSRLSTQITSSQDQVDLQTLTTDIPIFTRLVQQAQDAERGQPVGAAYLGEANALMQDHILDAAGNLYTSTKAKVDRADTDATRALPVIIVAAMFALALGGLVLLQWQMSRRFRRTINPPMLAATVLVIVALAWTALALGMQGRAVDQARREGSDPLATLTDARVYAQQLRADDALTILTRETNPSYQKDYDQLAAKLDESLAADSTGDVIAQARADAAAGYGQVRDRHTELRKAAVAVNPENQLEVVKLATEDQPAAFEHLEAVLANGVTDRSDHFGTVAASSLDDLRGLVLGLVVLGVAAIVLIVVGARRRLAEYR